MKALLRCRPLLAIALLVPLFASAATTTETVVSSPNDDREYQYLELENGLKVLLVSDADTDKAAAALDVAVGSADNPEGREGLAHFLEHMLFLGTEEFPEAGEYQAFISEHGGSHNAYTAFENTNYFFDIDQAHLYPALQRFSQFFVAPLFNAEYVDREKNAVHSEYQARLREDGRRTLAAIRTLGNPAHPASRFHVGSLKTLADRDGSTIRDELLRFYDAHYSADIMTLVVLGRESLDELEVMVRELFSDIPDRDAKVFRTTEPLFTAGTLPARINIEPVKDERSLVFYFPTPPTQEHYRTKPLNYLGNLVGHEGEGSLLSWLKKKGWSEGISGGAGLMNRDNAAFYLSVQLTQAGYAEIDAVYASVLSYLDSIRENGISEWRFTEQRAVNELRFQFQEPAKPIGLVSQVASNLQLVGPADVLRYSYLMDRFDADLIGEYAELLRADNALVAVIAKGVETDTNEEWYGVPYKVTEVAFESPASTAEFGLPPANAFLPETTAMLGGAGVSSQPALLLDEPGISLWYGQDTSYEVPRASYYLSYRTDSANDDIRAAVLTDLFTRAVKDQLVESGYAAQLAGLEYDIYPHVRGFSVKLSGFDDKLDRLLSLVLETIGTFQIDGRRFNDLKDELVRDYRNTLEDLPYRQVVSEIQTLVLSPSWPNREKIAVAAALEPMDLVRHAQRMGQTGQVVALAHGNLDKASALAMTEQVRKAWLANAEPADVAHGQVLQLRPGEWYQRELEVAHKDSALVTYFQGTERGVAERAMFKVLAQVLSAPFYHDLRTEKQRGYIVYAGERSVLEVPGLAFIVQSPVLGPEGLQQDVHAFLRGYGETIATMSDEEFSSHKQGVLTRILEAERTLQARSERYWREIDMDETHFETRERLAEAVEGMRLDDFKQRYAELVGADTARELSVVARGQSHGAAPAAAASAPRRPIIVTNSTELANGHDYFVVEIDPENDEA